MKKQYKLYTDGGVILKNPSYIGGTYAFLVVDEKKGKIIRQSYGWVTPEEMKSESVTNNQTELLAMTRGLWMCHMEKIPIVEVVSDSKVTIDRMFHRADMKNIPSWLVMQARSVPIAGIQPIHVHGHDGQEWNELADELCNRAAYEYLVKTGRRHLISPRMMKRFPHFALI